MKTNAFGRGVVLLAALLVLAVPFGSKAQTVVGSGKIVSQDRPISDRSRLKVCCGFTVKLSQGPKPALKLTGDDNVLPLVVVEDADSGIEVRMTEGRGLSPSRNVVVEVTLPKISSFKGSGGISLHAGAISAVSLAVSLSGGSTAVFDQLDAKSFALNQSGGGDVTLKGKVAEQSIEMSGGSIYNADVLDSGRATIDMSGGSKASLKVRESLAVSASGGSEVAYSGNPVVTKHLSGGSSVTQR